MLEKGWKPDIITYSLLMKGLFQGKNVDVALSLWHHVLDKVFKPDVTMHNIIIHGLCSVAKLRMLYSSIQR